MRDSEALRGLLKKMLVETLRLEHITVQEIENDAPLFVEGLGLDSIDALELVVAIEKNFNVIIEDEDVGRKAFASINALVGFIQEKYEQAE